MNIRRIAREFLPLVRFWHEEANNIEIWQRLRIIVVHSTNVYIPLEINQSPFNLGLPILLPEFTREQVWELANRHQFAKEIQDLDRKLASLMDLVSGYPFLIRQAFYALSSQEISFERLIEEAPTPSGIYRSHLHGYFANLSKYPELMSTFARVVQSESPIQISSIIAYKLESMGLIKLVNNKVIASCHLYRLYFRDYV